MEDIARCVASIRAARAALNWPQKKLAEESQVATVTIARLESGMAVPNGKTLSKIKGALEHGGALIADNTPRGGFSLIVTPTKSNLAE